MNKNNPIKSFQKALDTSLQKKGKLIQKKSKKISGKEDYIYKIVLTVFGLLAVYELGKWLLSHYTFERAVILFVLLSGVYFFIKTFSKKSFAAKIMLFLRKNKDNFVYGSFVVYFLIFLTTFIFKVSNLFTYATYLMIAVYGFFKVLGFNIDYTLPKTKLNNSVFLRLMLISMSVFLVVCNYILRAYEVTVSTKLIYIFVAVLYIVLFVFFFGKVSFKDLRWYLKSRRFKRFVASNTYNILSLLVIIITVSGLAYKFGYFDGIFKKAPTEIVVETPEPIETVDVIPQTEPGQPATRTVLKQISDIYNFNNRLEVGSKGEEVSKLQGFLGDMKYLQSEPTGVFEEDTRVALRDALMERCDWPESTRGILGVQAMACINNLEVEVVEDIPEGESLEEVVEENTQEVVPEESQKEEIIEETQPELPFVEDRSKEVVEEGPSAPEVIEPEVTPEEIEAQETPEPQVEKIETKVEEIQSETEEIVGGEPIKRVSDLYIFTDNLQAGDTGNQVSNLKDILSVLGYYKGELNADFDEETKIALKKTLIEKCNWPESTKGILGPQARTCINTIVLPSQ